MAAPAREAMHEGGRPVALQRGPVDQQRRAGGRPGNRRHHHIRAPAILDDGQPLLRIGDGAPVTGAQHAACGVAGGALAQRRIVRLAAIAIGAQPLLQHEAAGPAGDDQ
eukprot:gene52099-69711_t